MNGPLAFHLTWTTYGTWLPGDARGWIAKGRWGIHPPDPKIEKEAREAMAEDAVWLTTEQRSIVETRSANIASCGNGYCTP